MKSKLSFLVCLVVIGLLTGSARADIVVSALPAQQSFAPGPGSTTLDLIADIPEPDAIIGFGIDALIDTLLGPGNLTIDNVTIGTEFDLIAAPDGDELAGIIPPFDSLWGDGVLLATVGVSWDDVGIWTVTPSVTPGDLTEGFPTPTGFADVSSFVGAQITAPEPGSLALTLLAGIALLRRRRAA
ncbi:MAG: PEP-CTERM sorting domain-containing protein [Phycisphaerales bacterium]|nr:PEP-CTERM sorting domain-containing protein [Phycisphaerales bacterium]